MNSNLTPAVIHIDTERTIGEISPLLFGGFAEHLGRCIYEGIYDPSSPHADERGFRRDVLDALRDLRFTTIRYPGGNFVSGYDWRDGVGPREHRPRRRDLAWQSVETNHFGTDEFIDFCREIHTEPMLGLNFGTGGIRDAPDLVEYCNGPAGTKFADLRIAHGHAHPHAVKYWCLGNEMDGNWQIAHLEMDEYARKAREAAKMMKWHDPSIKLVLCGSSGPQMSTYPEWDRVTLEACWDQVDYLSLHYYAGNRDNDTDSYLAMTPQFEEHVDTLAATLRYAKAKRRSKHNVYLSWDEWNVWYKNHEGRGRWTEAPHLLEEIYNLEDALVVAQWMSVFLRKCDVLKIACLAQIVNAIAPILTQGDRLLKQSIFYPFQLFREHAAGASLDLLVRAPQHETKRFGAMPLLDASGSFDAATGRQALFLVNRSQTDSLPVELTWQTGALAALETVRQVAGSDPRAANSFEHPDTVRAVSLPPVQLEGGKAELVLPPLSFTVLASR